MPRRADGEAELTAQDAASLEESAKIALLATVSPGSLPHVSLISSLQARGPRQLMFGQFSEGRSKDNLRRDPRAAFVVMTRDRRLWRGRARWTGQATSGEDYEMYNRKPRFRYNAYFGIHTVHYLDLVQLDARGYALTLGVVLGSLVTLVARRRAALRPEQPVLRPWAEALVSDARSLKFLAWIGADGFPVLVPVVPCQPAGPARLVFAPTVHRAELSTLTDGAQVAVFALNLQMESVLVRGRFAGYRRYAGLRAGALDIDWVYNSMPPLAGQIHPPLPVEAVEESDRSAWFTH